MRSPLQVLADTLLEQPVEDWIRQRRPALSWQLIRDELRDATAGKVVATPNTLRVWLIAADGEAARQQPDMVGAAQRGQGGD